MGGGTGTEGRAGEDIETGAVVGAVEETWVAGEVGMAGDGRSVMRDENVGAVVGADGGAVDAGGGAVVGAEEGVVVGAAAIVSL